MLAIFCWHFSVSGFGFPLITVGFFSRLFLDKHSMMICCCPQMTHPSYNCPGWLGVKNNNQQQQKTSYLPTSHDFIHVKLYLDEFLKNGVSSLLFACQGRLIAYLCRHNQTGNLPTQYHERLGSVAALTQSACTLHHLNILLFFFFFLQLFPSMHLLTR